MEGGCAELLALVKMKLGVWWENGRMGDEILSLPLGGA
jgi:hypothetical protein